MAEQHEGSCGYTEEEGELQGLGFDPDRGGLGGCWLLWRPLVATVERTAMAD